MGFVARKSTRELTAVRTLELGSWFRAALESIPTATPEMLLAATATRLDYRALLEGTVTYVGPEGRVSLGQELGWLAPSKLTFMAHENALQFALGSIVTHKGGMGQVFDWAFNLTPNPDLTRVRLEFQTARTSNDSLVNKDEFRALLEAITDVLIDGVAIEPVTVASKADVCAALGAVPRPAMGRFELHPKSDVRLDPVSAPLFEALDPLLALVPGDVRSVLESRGHWPPIVIDNGALLVRTHDALSLRLAGGLIEKILFTTKIPEIRESLVPALDELNRASQSVARDDAAPMLNSDAEYMPFAIHGNADGIMKNVAWVLSTIGDIRVEHLKFRKLSGIPEQDRYWRLGYSHDVVDFGPSRSAHRAGFPAPQIKGLLPYWSTTFAQSDFDSGSPYHITLQMRGLTYDVTETIPGSDTLVSHLGHAATVLSDEGESATLWRVRGGTGAV